MLVLFSVIMFVAIVSMFSSTAPSMVSNLILLLCTGSLSSMALDRLAAHYPDIPADQRNLVNQVLRGASGLRFRDPNNGRLRSPEELEDFLRNNNLGRVNALSIRGGNGRRRLIRDLDPRILYGGDREYPLYTPALGREYRKEFISTDEINVLVGLSGVVNSDRVYAQRHPELAAVSNKLKARRGLGIPLSPRVERLADYLERVLPAPRPNRANRRENGSATTRPGGPSGTGASGPGGAGPSGAGPTGASGPSGAGPSGTSGPGGAGPSGTSGPGGAGPSGTSGPGGAGPSGAGPSGSGGQDDDDQQQADFGDGQEQEDAPPMDGESLVEWLIRVRPQALTLLASNANLSEDDIISAIDNGSGFHVNMIVWGELDNFLYSVQRFFIDYTFSLEGITTLVRFTDRRDRMVEREYSGLYKNGRITIVIEDGAVELRDDLVQRVKASDEEAVVEAGILYNVLVRFIPQLDTSGVNGGTFVEFDSEDLYVPPSPFCYKSVVEKICQSYGLRFDGCDGISLDLFHYNRQLVEHGKYISVRKLGDRIPSSNCIDLVMVEVGVEKHIIWKKNLDISDKVVEDVLDTLYMDEQYPEMHKSVVHLEKKPYKQPSSHCFAFFDLETFQEDVVVGYNLHCYAAGWTEPLFLSDISEVGVKLASLVRTKKTHFCPECLEGGGDLVWSCKHCGRYSLPYYYPTANLRRKRSRQVLDARCHQSPQGHEYVCATHPEVSKDVHDCPSSDYVISDSDTNSAFSNLNDIFNSSFATDASQNCIWNMLEGLRESVKRLAVSGKIHSMKPRLKKDGEGVSLELELSVYGFNNSRFDNLYITKYMKHWSEEGAMKLDTKDFVYTTRGFLKMDLVGSVDVTDSELRGMLKPLTKYKCGISSDKTFLSLRNSCTKCRVRLSFKDCLKMTSPTSLDKALKECKVPKCFRKGNFDHDRVRTFCDVESCKDEAEDYLRNDVVGLMIFFSSQLVSFRKSLKIEGVRGSENMFMHEYLTLPSLASTYINRKANSSTVGKSVVLRHDHYKLKEFVQGSVTGGKVEVYRNCVEYDPDLYAELGIDAPPSPLHLIAGMQPTQTMCYFLSNVYQTTDEVLEEVGTYFSRITCSEEDRCKCVVPRYIPGQNLESYLLRQPHLSLVNLVQFSEEVLEPHSEVDQMVYVKECQDFILQAVEDVRTLEEGLKELDKPPAWSVVEVDANSLYPTMYQQPMPAGAWKFDGLSSTREERLKTTLEDREASSGEDFHEDFQFYEGAEFDMEMFRATYDFVKVYEPELEDFPRFNWWGIFMVDVEYRGRVEQPFTSTLPTKFSGNIWWDLRKKSKVKLTSHDLYISSLLGWVVTEFYWTVMIPTSNIYRDVIKDTYEVRKLLKSDKDLKEKSYKLVMNSCYGQSNMKNQPTFKFFKDSEMPEVLPDSWCKRSIKEIGGGYLRVKTKEEKEFIKSNHMGVFVLASARMYMHWVAKVLGFFDCDANQLEHKIYYTDTDSFYLSYSAVPEMEKRKLIGNDLGQFKIDTGNGINSFILAGTFNVRKHYSLIYFDGERLQFKIKQKGLSNPLKMNSAMSVFTQNEKFVKYEREGKQISSEGLMTNTTKRVDGSGVLFYCLNKKQRVGVPRTKMHWNDPFLRIPLSNRDMEGSEDQYEDVYWEEMDCLQDLSESSQ